MNLKAIVAPIVGIMGAVLIMVIGSIFSGVVLTQFASSGASTLAPSFSGAKATNDLMPTLYYLILIIISLSLLIGGVLVGRNASRS